MPSLAQIRAQYPQYRDLSDEQFANALHAKAYSDMPRAEFDKRVGLGGNTSNPVMGAITTLNRSVPFMDEAADALQSGVNLAKNYKLDPSAGLSSVGDAIGDSWAKARAASGAASQHFESAHPHAAALTRGVGMAAQALPAFATGGATAAPQVASAGKGLLANLATKAAPVAKGAVTGGLLAGLNGVAGEGDLSERLQTANRDIPMGAAVGGAVPLAIGAAGKVANAVSARMAPEETQAAIKAGNVLASRAPDSVNVPAPEGDELPFEAWGGGGKSLARAVSNVPGPGQDIAEEVLNARRAGAPDRMLTATKDALGGEGGDFHPTLQMVDATRRAQAGPLYDAAEQTPIHPTDYQSHIQPLLETDLGRKAVGSAHRIAQADEILTGKPSHWVDNIVGDKGVEQVQTPNAKTLDYVARGFDEALSPYRNQFGKLEGLTDEGRTMVALRNEYVKRLGELVPKNAEARAAWAGPTQQMDAMQLGRKVVTGRMDPELVAQNTEGLSADQLDAQRLGMARGVSDQLRGANPQKIMRAISNDQVLQDRLRAAFKDDDAFNAFMGAAKTEAGRQQTYNGLLSGSRTTPLREDISAANDSAGDGDALDMALSIAKKRLGGQSFLRQGISAGMNAVDRVRTPALNDPAVSQLLGEVLFKGRAPREVIQQAIAAKLITPEQGLRLMPILSAGAGASAGSEPARAAR